VTLCLLCACVLMFLLTPVRVYICNPMQLKLCSSTLVHLAALFEHAAQQHTQLCSSTPSSVRAHRHTQLCSSTRTIMFLHTYAYAKLVQEHTALATLLASSAGHSAATAALLVHVAAALCYITCSPRLLVMLLQLSSDRSACSVVDGLETVAAMVVLSQPGPCARHVRRGISHHQKPAVWSRLSLSRCNPQLQRTLACCHGPRRFELRLGHSKFVGLGLLI